LYYAEYHLFGCRRVSIVVLTDSTFSYPEPKYAALSLACLLSIRNITDKKSLATTC
jgi:hypothetical protein